MKCAPRRWPIGLRLLPRMTSTSAGKFRIIGQQLLTPSAPAGEPLTLLVAYRVEAPPDPTTSFFVHLVNPDGSVIGQADQTVQTGRYQSRRCVRRTLRGDTAVECAAG